MAQELDSAKTEVEDQKKGYYPKDSDPISHFLNQVDSVEKKTIGKAEKENISHQDQNHRKRSYQLARSFKIWK